MDSNTPIKYSDLIQPDNSIKDLQQQLKDLAEEYKVLMDGIKAQANSLKNSLSSMSGATTQGQQAIKNASALAEKLARKEMELAQARSETAKQLAVMTLRVKDANNEVRLAAKLAERNAGELDIMNASYDALSARYAQIKNDLNKMTTEERKAGEAGQKLEQEAAAIYAQMKKLQEVTGKHVLSVGDYGVATANLASDIRNGIQALTQMRIEMKLLEGEGQKGSERWQELSDSSQKLANDLKDLKRQYQIVKLETNALGQQTKYLNDAIGVLSAGAGGLSALTGTMKLFGSESNGAAEALIQLNSVMAIANGISQVYNGIFKSGNILLAIRSVNTWLATKAQEAQNKSTKTSIALQKALNILVKVSSNPYALLAVAIGAVVGALAALLNANAKLIKQQKMLNQLNEASAEYVEVYYNEVSRLGKENQKALEQELAIAQARKAGYSETQRIENAIQDQKARNNAQSRGFYAEEISNLQANREELERLRGELLKAKSVEKNTRIEIQLDAEGPAQRIKADKVIDIIQGKIDNLNKKVEIATELTYDEQQLEADAKALQEQHRQQALEVAALERSTLRNAEDVQLALLSDRFDRERALERARTERQIIDLKVQLQTENNLTLKARQAINDQIIDLEKQLGRTLEDITNEEISANIDAIRELEDLRFNARQDTAEKQREMLKAAYDRDIEDIERRLKTERDLTETEAEALVQQLTIRWQQYAKDVFELEAEIRSNQLEKEAQAIENRLALVSEESTEAMNLRLEALENERQAELNANRVLANDMRQDEAEINAKYDQLALEEFIKSQNEMNEARLEAEQEYDASVFDLRMHSERQINLFQLQQQKERLQAELKAQENLVEIQTGEVKENTLKTIEALKNQIAAIDKEMRAEKGRVTSIWDLFGFDSDAAEAMKIIADQIISSLREITQARIEAADKAVEAARREIDATQKVLEYQLEARANGYANEVETVQKELELSKKREQNALAIKQKAQRDQARLDTLSQMSSLVTASANIWSSLSGIPVIGIGLALAGIATMWGSFALAKARAAQISKEAYGQGTVELLKGGSHQSGNDVDLGTKPDGTRRRAEGGEFFAVINKRNSRRYRSIIPDVINSLNDGTFGEKYLNAYNKLGDFAFAAQGAPTDVSKLEKDVEEIRKQGDTKIYMDKQGNTTVVYKNLTRRLKN